MCGEKGGRVGEGMGGVDWGSPDALRDSPRLSWALRDEVGGRHGRRHGGRHEGSCDFDGF